MSPQPTSYLSNIILYQNLKNTYKFQIESLINRRKFVFSKKTNKVNNEHTWKLVDAEFMFRLVE